MPSASRILAGRLSAAGATALALAACAAQTPSTTSRRAETTPALGARASVSATATTAAGPSGSPRRRPAHAVTVGQLAASTRTIATTSAATGVSGATVTGTSDSRPGQTPALPLTGKTIGIDPGHNGGNFTDPSYIDRLIWNGREMETCNTTGTATDSGYTEAQFNFNVAMSLAADLRAQGARTVLTRHTNTGVGPCVNVRAHIIDQAGAQVAIDIHADGGPPGGRGVAILEPVADGINNRIIGASERFGRDVLHQIETVAGMPPSTYDGTDGIVFRDDLAGLNLTTVPEVLIESGNMRNATDAALLTTPGFQRLEAHALDRAILQFLTGAP
ncbi:MAG: N-acetylmuramoyl-L-alanine amidase [Solirubrobacteraceae bacterium]|jgi:N-acetylmuramoyl-L-alanine amidase